MAGAVPEHFGVDAGQCHGDDSIRYTYVSIPPLCHERQATGMCETSQTRASYGRKLIQQHRLQLVPRKRLLLQRPRFQLRPHVTHGQYGSDVHVQHVYWGGERSQKDHRSGLTTTDGQIHSNGSQKEIHCMPIPVTRDTQKQEPKLVIE
jgi:hypothetical protein